MISVIAWLRSAIAQGRLAFVRRFEFNIGGDWVFAVTRVEHAWQRFRAPEVPDGAGFSPSQELGRLLAGKVTYSGTTFGRVSHPVAYSEIKGPMDVNGLAMSPFGIRSVTLLIDDGRYRVPLPLYERIDFTRAFPWYPLTPRTAFGTAVPRPRNIWKMTDVQVEIVDGRGKITLLPDIPLTWR